MMRDRKLYKSINGYDGTRMNVCAMSSDARVSSQHVTSGNQGTHPSVHVLSLHDSYKTYEY